MSYLETVLRHAPAGVPTAADFETIERPALRAPAAVMVNLLGSHAGPGRPQGLAEALAIPDIHVHLYGKTRVAAGRKMGHVTALGATIDSALERAESGAAALGFAQE